MRVVWRGLNSMHLQTDSGMTEAEKRVLIGITGIGITMVGAVIAHGGTIRILILVLVHIVMIADHSTNGVIVLRILVDEKSFNI